MLHTCWDTFPGLWAFLILAVISLGWLFWALHRYRTFSERGLAEPGHERRGRPAERGQTTGLRGQRRARDHA